MLMHTDTKECIKSHGTDVIVLYSVCLGTRLGFMFW